MQVIRAFIVAVVVVGSATLLHLIDDGLGIGWPQNVIRNWQDFGFLQLGGKLVINPGGFEVTSHPDIYKGMSPVSLYPAYFTMKLCGWTGLGTMSYHILLALAVFWAIWKLLGQDSLAFVAAAIAIMLPGYLVWQKGLDPNTVPILLGLPYVAVLISILKRRYLRFAAISVVCLLTLGFTAINWTTAWIFAPCTLLLWFLPSVKRSRTIWFVASAGLCSSILVIGSVLSRAGSEQGTASTSALIYFIGAYTWGNVGYGSNLTTVTALLRLVFVNGIALMPLLVLFAWIFWRKSRDGRMRWVSISPFVLTVLVLGIMRNYFGHHPWMASPLLLVGLIFSMSLAREFEKEAEFGTFSLACGWNAELRNAGILIFCFAYSLSVILLFRSHEQNVLALVALIRQHTERSDVVIVLNDLDPKTAVLAPRFPYSFDRNVLVVKDLQALPVRQHGAVILSTQSLYVPKSICALLGRTYSGSVTSYSVVAKIDALFNQFISRRRSGDRLEVEASYHLYRCFDG